MLKRIKNAFGKLSIRKKMFLAVIPAMLLLVFVFFAVFRIMFNDLRDNAIESNGQLLSRLESDLDGEMKSIRVATNTLISSPEVKNYLSSKSTILDRMKLQSTYKYDLPKTSHLDGYMFIKEPGDYVYLHLSEPLSERDRSMLSSYVCAQQYRNEYAPFVAFPDHNSANANCLCHILPVADQNAKRGTLAIGGYLVLVQSRYFLSDITAPYYGAEQAFYITDGEGRSVWNNTGTKRLPSFISGNRSKTDGAYTDSGNGYLYVYRYLDTYNWMLTVAVPMDSITDTLNRYVRLFWISGIIALVLSVCMVYVISSFITRRLSEMTNVIQNVQDGDLDCRYPVVFQDEISVIGNQFNQMLDEIETYHITSAKQELNQRDAELHALQSQISPHFLYNSLDCIRSTALVHSDTEAADQIQVLSSMFRYTTGSNDRNRLVTIREEIRHIEDYITMQKYRFADRFDFSVSVEDRILDLKTPKLILQPVAENAFTHGIRQMTSGGKLTVRGSLNENGHVCLTVTDNGAGISAERLDYLRTQLAANPLTPKDTPFMALVNTNDRLKIAYGPDFGITIQSREGLGTTVTILLPAITGENAGPQA